ncbi:MULTISPECIES: hypothetical protein [Halorubrum]|uniref:Uncharacterized protein n=1 Tax=Halorubrum hochstenium ATCC 700873 TaxID=1227481 RepID=M0F532_9EURY|nr:MULTISPECIES: hypothetical protein [Halorubrum]ELZ55015.1 hypothetical protein C467_09826 [Halorubrum hochstenium ATCC 700873]
MSDASERTRGEVAADGSTAAGRTTDGDGSAASDGEPSRFDRTWYRSPLGIAVIAVDLLLTVALAAAASLAIDAPLAGVDGLSPGVVPPSVPLFSLLGALGFVFTTLIERFDVSVGTLVRYNFRLPAALPLGVGIYLLSDVVLGQGVDDVPLVVGVVFLSGLYVNLAYKRLGALARRLLPAGRDESEGGGTTAGGPEGDAN